jgi:hypothetical protein
MVNTLELYWQMTLFVDVVGILQVHEYLAWWILAYLCKASFILSFYQSKNSNKQLDLGDLPL